MNKSPAELKTIQLFYEAVNDQDDQRTIGEHITQLLIDLYDCHLVVSESGRVYCINQEKLKIDDDGERYQQTGHTRVYPDELPDLFS